MLNYIRIVPLTAESLGVRSMCTYVETSDLKILLDAGVSLCPSRFRLPPHPIEFKAIDEARRRIAEAAERAEIVTLSHYHFDHHTPSYEDWLCNWTATSETARQIYDGKIVLIKSITARDAEDGYFRKLAKNTQKNLKSQTEKPSLSEKLQKSDLQNLSSMDLKTQP